MSEGIAGLAIMFFAMVGLITCVNAIKNPHWTQLYLEKPYCESSTIQGQKYKRCWKSIEVEPPKEAAE